MIIKDGAKPTGLYYIGRNGTEHKIKVYYTDKNGNERIIWDYRSRGSRPADGKARVVFKSYDGRMTYSTAWYTPGSTVTKPVNPTRPDAIDLPNERRTIYTFAGWATTPNATSGITGNIITDDAADLVYYAAFTSVTKSLYPTYTYSGNATLTKEAQYAWIITVTSGGTLNFSNLPSNVDVFLVGGGGGSSGSSNHEGQMLGGGSGGYTRTYKNVSLSENTNYGITIGAGGAGGAGGGWGGTGGTTSAFGYSAAGGGGGAILAQGGAGGTGGNGFNYWGGVKPIDGADGEDGQGASLGSIGQHTTTRAFGESTGELYSNGGADGSAVRANHGDGGASKYSGSATFITGNAGSAGVVIIRSHR